MKITPNYKPLNLNSFYQASQGEKSDKPEKKEKSTIESSSTESSSCLSKLAYPFLKIWELISSALSYLFCGCCKAKIDIEELKTVNKLLAIATKASNDKLEKGDEETFRNELKNLKSFDRLKKHVACAIAEEKKGDVTNLQKNYEEYKAEVDKIFNAEAGKLFNTTQSIGSRNAIQLITLAVVSYKIELLFENSKLKGDLSEELEAVIGLMQFLDNVKSDDVYGKSKKSASQETFENFLNKLDLDRLKTFIAISSAFFLEDFDTITDLEELKRKYQKEIDTFFNQDTKKILSLEEIFSADLKEPLLVALVCYRVPLIFC